MTEYHFQTPTPVQLHVELGKGSLAITAAPDLTESHVEITGDHADAVRVELGEGVLSIVAPRQRIGFFGGDDRIDVSVTVPQDSDLSVRSGSADIVVDGPMGAAQVRSGSGDLRADAFGGTCVVETGSGEIRIQDVRGELRVKSGSGDITLGRAGSDVLISTGSGDIEIGSTHGAAVVKTGSGDLQVDECRSDVSLTTGSGDLRVRAAHRGRVTAKGGSSDIRIGIPVGVAVWTDISTTSGKVRSNLAPTGEPADGADHVELRATTHSGNIVLQQV